MRARQPRRFVLPSFALVLALLLAVLPASPGAAPPARAAAAGVVTCSNYVVNGSFESPGLPGAPEFPAYQPTRWLGSVSAIGSPFPPNVAADGDVYVAALNSGLTQSIPTDGLRNTELTLTFTGLAGTVVSFGGLPVIYTGPAYGTQTATFVVPSNAAPISELAFGFGQYELDRVTLIPSFCLPVASPSNAPVASQSVATQPSSVRPPRSPRPGESATGSAASAPPASAPAAGETSVRPARSARPLSSSALAASGVASASASARVVASVAAVSASLSAQASASARAIASDAAASAVAQASASAGVVASANAVASAATQASASARAANQPPIPATGAAATVRVTSDPTTIFLYEYASDPDGDMIFFVLTSSTCQSVMSTSAGYVQVFLGIPNTSCAVGYTVSDGVNDAVPGSITFEAAGP